MGVKFTQLQCKEVICIANGERLGFLSDIVAEVPEGVIAPLWCPAPANFWEWPDGRTTM